MSYLARLNRIEKLLKDRVSQHLITTLCQLTIWSIGPRSRHSQLSPRLAEVLNRAMAAKNDPLE